MHEDSSAPQAPRPAQAPGNPGRAAPAPPPAEAAAPPRVIAYRPCLGCGRPTRSMTGYCRRANTGPCKRGYNAEWHQGAGVAGYVPPWLRPGGRGQDEAPGRTGPAGLTAGEWNAVGLPFAGPGEPDWSGDLFSATTTDLGAGNPRNGTSPWPSSWGDL